MSTERKIILAVVALAVVVILVLLFYPSAKERFLPQPVAAWVAIEVEGSGEAVVGPVDIDAGKPFRLHAVLEAEDRDGARVFYTEAEALRLPDGPVPEAALRRWDRGRNPKILWFTVEGGAPYLELETLEQLERFHFEPLYRPSWPQAWSIPGRVDPLSTSNDAYLFGADRDAFGTQRYHVRFEVYSDDEALLPDQRFKSWSVERLPAEAETFPTAVVRLDGPLAPASAVFGLTQIEPVGDNASELRPRLDELSEELLAFTRLGVVAEVLRTVGKRSGDLVWRPIDLDGGAAWGQQVAAGDLLQVAERVVLLYADRGTPGVLDPADLCFDFARGAEVRPLEEVFDLGADAEVSWAALRSPSA